MDEAENKIIENLILEGALEFAGFDPETGEMLYNFSNKVKVVMPELYEQHLKTVNRDVMYLWENGYLELDLFSDNPIVSLSNKAMIESEVEKLSPDNRRSLNEIKRILLP
jgi:hypothetical protein